MNLLTVKVLEWHSEPDPEFNPHGLNIFSMVDRSGSHGLNHYIVSWLRYNTGGNPKKIAILKNS